MLTFAITTTTKLAGLSLHKKGKYLGEVKVEVAKTHSTTILEQIDRLFEWTGTTLDEVENVLVSIGPGSFTGVRIAIAVVKGLFFNILKLLRPAFSINIILGIPSFEVAYASVFFIKLLLIISVTPIILSLHILNIFFYMINLI